MLSYLLHALKFLLTDVIILLLHTLKLINETDVIILLLHTLKLINETDFLTYAPCFKIY